MTDPKTAEPTREQLEADISIDADPEDVVAAIAQGYGVTDDGHHPI